MTAEPSPASAEPVTGGRANAAAWALLSPLLLWLGLFVVTPTLILLVYSFFRGTGVNEIETAFTPSNYARVFSSTYLAIFWRSLRYATETTLLCVLIGYPVAYRIGRASARVRQRMLLLVMIPFWTSFLIRTYAWFIILQRHGVLNGALEMLGIVPHWIAPLELLYSQTAVLITLVYTYLPFMILPIYASVEKLDSSLLEAAADLGASPSRAFLHITLPLTLPGIAAGVTMVFIPAIAMFAVTSLMSGGRVRLIGDEIQEQFYGAGDLPFGSALGMVLLALFIGSFWMLLRATRSNLLSSLSGRSAG